MHITAHADLVGMLNDARFREGKPPLGWLNPALYLAGVGAKLVDVTESGSIGCTAYPVITILYASWNATAGWDPLAGFGVPDF
jgi:tripeptidyl-peptidase I